MSQGSIKNRIQQNNEELEDVIDVVETLPDATDTSDATATSADIVEGKTAYANNTKLTGAMQVLTYPYPYSEYHNYDYEFYEATAKSNVVRDGTSYVLASYQVVPSGKPDTWALTGNRKMKLGIPYNVLASAINLTASKIKANTTVMGVTGTYTSDANATAADILQGKTAYVNGTKITGTGAGSDGSSLNVFTQLTEPTTKSGIWLQKNTEFENVTAVDSISSEPSWLPDGTARDIPYDFYYGSATAVGTDIYLFGGYDNNTYEGKNLAYKYDTLTNTYTQLTNIPYSGHRIAVASVGTNIYLFDRFRSAAKLAYKYDTLTDTYTQLTNIPVSLTSGSATAVGTDIYLFGGDSGSSSYELAYKYDTLTDTYTKLTDVPYYFRYGTVVTVGNNIYLLGTSDYNRNYKYDISTDTYTQLTNIPVSLENGSATAIGTNIYLFGGTSNKTTVYKYDTLTDTYTQLTDIPYNFYAGSSVNVTNNIYLFGGTDYKTKVQVLDFPTISFNDNSVVLLNGNTYETQLYSNELVDNSVKYPFSDVYYYTEQDGLDGTIPTYYGDGTSWVNIKN